MTSIIELLEQHLPNYYGDADVALLNDLYCIFDEKYSDDDDKDKLKNAHRAVSEWVNEVAFIHKPNQFMGEIELAIIKLERDLLHKALNSV